jgi:GT2 family glycosyltransferase/tetratricopeptide (TPR) repeat protein/SAM-dependent methyltransferase
MLPRRIAVLFDDLTRPETTGGYCLSALRELAKVEHFRPGAALPADGFDLYLRIDDGLDERLPEDRRPSAWWAIDTHLGFERCLAQAGQCDLTFAAQRDGAQRLRQCGIASATWLPLACDPNVHRLHKVPKQFDLAFVGNLFPRRSELLELIRRRYRNVFIGNRYFEEMAKTYSAAKTVFNCSIRNDINMRVFEALACGSLLLTNDLAENGQAELFADGTHLGGYRDAEEMLDKLAFYLAHADSRRKVEQAGLCEVVAKHTYRHRMETILAAAESLPKSVPVNVSANHVHSPAPAQSSSGYDPGYFEFDRPELLALVPKEARDILDVGCGAGRFGAALKSRQLCRVTGLELDAAAAAAARKRLDEVHQGDVESTLFPIVDGSLDAVVCGDVLEHLREPLTFLRRVRGWLRPGGTLVASLPNVRHQSVVRSLLEGNWTYEPAGLLDRTHLRFFTRRELEKLLHRAGFAQQSLAYVPGPGYAEWAAQGKRGEVRIGRLHIAGLDPADAEEFHVYQLLVTAKPTPTPDYGLTSIVILTHNQLEFTRQCVDSIRLVTDEPIELVFVDNGSTDATPEYLRALAATDPRVKVITNNSNRGFPAGCNQGIAAATGRQILLLNNDTLVTTGWLSRLLHALHSNPAIGLVGPCTDNVSGEQAVPTNFDGIESLDGFAWDWAKMHDRQIEDTDRLVGFCLVIRRELIEKIGVLDERFGIGCYEDDDYCRRALAAGFRAVIARDVFIHHAGGATFRGSGVDFGALMRENEQRFQQKWSASELLEAPKPQPAFELEIGGDGGLRLLPAKPRLVPVTLRRNENGWTIGSPTILVSLCMIVRNNERTIRAALESIRPYVDEMIVVDTGSTDRTIEICKELGARVYHFPWCDDFSAARNESIKYAHGKWIFWMDSDDVIDEANGNALRKLVCGPHDPNVFGYSMNVHHPGRSGDPDDYTLVDHIKLFRNRPDLRFEFRIHEQILMPIRRAGGTVQWTDLFVIHSGYDRSSEGQRQKLERDFRILHKDLEEHPNHPFVLFNLGMTHADIGEYSQAIDYMRRSIAASEPGATHLRKAYTWLIGALLALELRDEARRECLAGLQMFPQDIELRFWLGKFLADENKIAEAITVFEDLLANPGPREFSSVDRGVLSFKAWENLAALRERQGNLSWAEDLWRSVVKDAPQYRPGWRGLWQNLLTSGKISAAATVAEQLLCDGPLQSEGAVASAHIAVKHRDLGQARRVMEQAVQRFPQDVELLQDWSQMLFERFNPAEAVPVLTKIVELVPQHASAWHNLGQALACQGQHQQAVAAFEESLVCRPDYPPTLIRLGQAQIDCGRIEEAGRTCERVLQLAPGQPEATDLLKQLGRV